METKAFFAIVLITLINPPWFVGGAPPQAEPRKDSQGGKNVTLLEQKGQEQPEASRAHQTSKAGSPGTLGTELLKNLAGIYPGEDHGNNNTNPISHPITDSDLQNQLNELRTHPGEGGLNRKEDMEGGTYNAEEGMHLQTITLDKEYTPQDIAEYIFWTGDERGVVMGFSQLLNDGLMSSQDDVIKFLENVKSELDYLRDRYEMSLSGLTPPPSASSSPISSSRNTYLQREDDRTSFYSKASAVDPFESKFQRLIQQAHDSRHREQKDPGVTLGIRSLKKRRISHSSHSHPDEPRFGSFRAYDPNRIILPPSTKKNIQASADSRYNFPQVPYRRSGPAGGPEREGGLGIQGPAQTISEDDFSNGYGYSYNGYDNNNIQIRNNNNNEEPDFSEIIQRRMKVADDRLRELSLENIIYNLARELFSQNFKQGPGSGVLDLDAEAYTSGGGGSSTGSVGYPDHHQPRQQQIEKVSRFIERNLISERTPQAIEKEVQDILFTALLDSAREQRDLGTFGRSMGNFRNKRDARFRRQINPPFQSPARYL